jgi:hypothetical protein
MEIRLRHCQLNTAGYTHFALWAKTFASGIITATCFPLANSPLSTNFRSVRDGVLVEIKLSNILFPNNNDSVDIHRFNFIIGAIRRGKP